MSRKHQTNRKGKMTPPQANKRPVSIGVGIVLAAVVVGCLGFWWWRAAHPTILSLPESPQPAAASQAETASPPATAKPDFKTLKGKWIRPDGGYVLDIKYAANDGKIDAAYLNPNSIHVSRAEWTYKDDALTVFVELRDINYPGSTYTLAYNPDADQLVGIYFQAATQQTFDIVFVRMQ